MLPSEILQLLRILLLYLYNVEFDVNPPPPPRPLKHIPPPLVNSRFSNVDFIIFQNCSTTDNFCTDDLNTPPLPSWLAAKKNKDDGGGGIT